MRGSELSDAGRRVAAGGSVINLEPVGESLGRTGSQSPLDELTRCEGDVFKLMAGGRSNQWIADQLVLEPKTIEGHIRTVFPSSGSRQSPPAIGKCGLWWPSCRRVRAPPSRQAPRSPLGDLPSERTARTGRWARCPGM